MANKPNSGAAVALNYLLASATVHLLVSGVEVSTVGTNYSPQNFGTVTVVGNTAANQADIVFGPASSNWGSVDSLQIKKSGTVIYSKTFSATAVNSGYSAKFSAGALTVQETLWN